ncbi:hypothetical protein E2C01_059672 [Portunus trituberculatus]|uniref:Uncharacterized protein n=1 Tax=Portunus trituberculatus TaxID=210409 RepID=A0A5B7H7B1_PORTR|nr:hypothetical protein [Portunus trituberculatus]
MLSVHRAGRREAVSHLGVPQRPAGEAHRGETASQGPGVVWGGAEVVQGLMNSRGNNGGDERGGVPACGEVWEAACGQVPGVSVGV